MIFLLNNWRWIAIGMIVLGLGMYGQYWKWQANKCEAAYENFRIEVSAVAAAAKAASEAKKATQAKTTKEVRNASKDNRSRISSYYGDGLRLPRTGSGGVPAPADRSKGADGAPAQCPASDPDLERKAALDAERLMAWQAWARGQGLPVE